MNCNYNKKPLKNVNLKNALPFYTPDFDLDENNLRELNLQIDCAVKSIPCKRIKIYYWYDQQRPKRKVADCRR